MRVSGVSINDVAKGVLKVGVYSALVLNDFFFLLILYFMPEDHNLTLTEWVMFALFMASVYLMVKELEREEKKKEVKDATRKRTGKSF